MKKIIISIISIVCVTLLSSCEDFLTTYPKDALSPSTTWNTEADAQKFLVGCYNNWFWGEEFFYMDCASDIGYSFHVHEGFQVIGNGKMTPSNTGSSFYVFTSVRRCDHFLANIGQVQMDEAKKKDMIAQVRIIRAYEYFNLNWRYGGVPIIPLSGSAAEAQVPRESEEVVKKHIFDEIDAALNGGISIEPASTGQVARGFALALKMRSALYYGDYTRALDAAKEIVGLNQYALHSNFSELFSYAGQDSKEIILSVQKIIPGAAEWFVTVPNNLDGGWSSMVPTQNLIDMYEMANGLTKEEAGSGYDPAHPFAGRDPRMAMTVLVPGIDWASNYNGVLNTLETALPNGSNNLNHPSAANNASKTGLTWAKYLLPLEQYGGVLDPTHTQYIVCRYAEVLLSLAEASNELNGPSEEVYGALNQIRNSRTNVKMPDVDRVKYGSKETLRELIRRERSIELAGEGHRRSDILRWKDASGKMLAETVLNGPLNRIAGTINYAETDQFKRAVISGIEKIEDRTFAVHNRYLPIPQSSLDRNPQLTPSAGY